jgi:predicted component of type VI protein secretion system
MAKLILSMDGLVLKEYALAKERTSVGRKPDNDIQIDNLAVSGDHAVIVTILNDSFLEDLDSTNGTLVNGQPVKKHFLQNNDIIELGKYRLKYVSEHTGQAKSADFEKTMMLRPGAMKAGMAVAAAVAAPEAAQSGLSDTTVDQGPALAQASAASPEPVPVQRVGMLQILSGGSAGKEMELTKSLTTLGKPGVQVAVITRRPQGYFITHVEGAQFPVLNGRTLDAQAHALDDHAVIELAGVKMEFFFKA